jgi:SRSO17 transposase
MAESVRPGPALLQQLEAYVGRFRGCFRRRDQARWAAVYLQGLLCASGRKSIENLAGSVVLPPDLDVTDVAQALQNFINQSPWDEQQLWRRYRALILEGLTPAARRDGAFVIQDIAFPKQGRHSVGVQRQYVAGLGRKINCQLAVSLHHASATGYRPLALRLYLPRGWASAGPRLEAAGVPPEQRRHANRAQLALELVDAVRAEGVPCRAVLAGGGYAAAGSFREGLAQRGLSYLVEVPAAPEPVPAEGEALLSWPAGEPRGSGRQAFAALPEAKRAQEGGRLWRLLERAERGCWRWQEELGLDHFEGRSWRGFHHHACLVMLAFGFRLADRGTSGAATEEPAPPAFVI